MTNENPSTDRYVNTKPKQSAGSLSSERWKNAMDAKYTIPADKLLALKSEENAGDVIGGILVVGAVVAATILAALLLGDVAAAVDEENEKIADLYDEADEKATKYQKEKAEQITDNCNDAFKVRRLLDIETKNDAKEYDIERYVLLSQPDLGKIASGFSDAILRAFTSRQYLREKILFLYVKVPIATIKYDVSAGRDEMLEEALESFYDAVSSNVIVGKVIRNNKGVYLGHTSETQMQYTCGKCLEKMHYGVEPFDISAGSASAMYLTIGVSYRYTESATAINSTSAEGLSAIFLNPGRSEEKFFGEDVVVESLAYYTEVDALNHALHDYSKQMENTIREIKTKRELLGQRLAVTTDHKDVLGEYPETKTKTPLSENQSLIRSYYIRPVGQYLCRFEIDICKMGMGNTRRTTYMLSQVEIIFYKKGGEGLGKEIILRSKVLRFRKKAPRNLTNPMSQIKNL